MSLEQMPLYQMALHQKSLKQLYKMYLRTNVNVAKSLELMSFERMTLELVLKMSPT
jgi:hypothetical protein